MSGRTLQLRRRLTALAVIWLSGAVATGVAQPQARPPSTPATDSPATLTGRLMVAGERETPIRRARLTLESSAFSRPQLADSDAEGRFRFDGLPVGAFRLRAEKPGYVTLAFGATHAGDRGLLIALTAGQTRAVELALPRGAALDGRVTNQEGDPVQNLVVSAVRLSFGPYGRQPASIKDARTDDLGRYRIHSLPPGDYFVQAAADPMDAFGERQAAGPRPPGIARTYYPGTANPAEGKRITLVAGRDAMELDFTIGSVSMTRVTLRVVDSTGNAPKALGTRIQRVGAPPGELRGMIQGGQALFPDVPPGEYWIMAAATPAPGASPEYAAMRMTIAGDDLTVPVKTAPALALQGRVEAEGGAMPATTVLRVVADAIDFELPSPGGAGAPIAPLPAIGADGRFTVGGLLGALVFGLTGLPEGWALSSVRLGGSDITGRPTIVKPTDAATDLVMVVTNNTGIISGVLSDAEKRPRANGRIVVFAHDERQWTARSRFVKTALAGADGAYAIGSLLPGDYLICAVEWLDDGAWLDPDVLTRLRAIASPIAIKGSDRHTVALTLGELR